MAAASEDEKLPYIRGVRLGVLFNSRTGEIAPPTKTPSNSGRKLKEPRTWKRWTVIKTGPDLYRALRVPFPLALKVLAGKASEPDVPLVEWRQALSSPNCRALLLQAGIEMRERTIEESACIPAVNPRRGMSHFVHRVVTGRQLFILVIFTAEDERDSEYIDAIFGCLPNSRDGFDGAKTVFKQLDSTIQRSKGIQASFSVRPEIRKEIRSLEEAVKLLSDFLSQPESAAEPSPQFADDDSSADEEDAKNNPVPIKCFLRPCQGAAQSEDLPAIPPLKERTSKAKETFDRLYYNCFRAEELLKKQPVALKRDYHKRELEKKRNTIAQIKREFEEVIETLSVFEKFTSREEKELVNKTKGDLEADTRAFLEELEYKLPPSTGPLNLLLLGKSGHGKSSTGNTILQLSDDLEPSEQFQSSGGTVSTTRECRMRHGEVDGQMFKIVDTPGVFDPSNFQEALEEICTAIAHCTEGFHAVLIVWKYGTKLTPEEIKSIECLKRVFGTDLLERHGVFLMTNGDQFELSRKKGEHSNASFAVWQKEQSKNDKNFQNIVAECKGRCTLFDNSTENAQKQRKQLLELVDILQRMRDSREYKILSNDLFKIARKNIRKLEVKMEELREKAQKLDKQIQVILKAAKKLPPEEREEIEKKLRLIRSYQLSLEDSILLGTDGLDKALEDADYLERDIEERADQANTQLKGSGIERTAPGSVSDISAQTDEVLVVARKIMRLRGKIVAEAGKKTAEESGASCFPGNATVRLQDGRQVKMTSLHEGDVVLCGRKDGSLAYSAVYMFGHKDEFPPLHCLALTTRTTTLRISHDHLVFRRHLGSCAAVPACHVQVGDAIAVYRPGAATLQWEPVTHIQSQWETGVMAPFTLEGTVVVDDVLASCYVAVTSHTLCHALLWPVRKLAVLAPRLSAHLHRPGEGGLPPWVRLCLHHLLPWLPPHRLLSA